MGSCQGSSRKSPLIRLGHGEGAIVQGVQGPMRLILYLYCSAAVTIPEIVATHAREAVHLSTGSRGGHEPTGWHLRAGC